MCGRMNITDNEGIRLLMELVGMPSWPTIQERYNISPTASLDVLISDNDVPAHQSMHWGIVPSWAKPDQFKRPLINARSETIWEKPSFKSLIKNQRALVPVTGFYEWKRDGDNKTPYYVFPADAAAMFFAGIWQLDKEGMPQVTLITTAANEAMATVHHRMPVIVSPDEAQTWLEDHSVDTLNAMMQPAANDVVAMREVGSYVNSSRNQGPECMEAVV